MRNHMAAGWFYSPSQIKRYFATRISSLKPPRTKLTNPWHIMREVNRHQWLMFTVGFLGWTWDAFDFFTVTMCLTEIATDFGVSNADVSWGVTVTLMLRSVGALIFGIFSDRYGRKWPMIINLGLFVVLELGSAFTTNLTQFLAVRSLYGIAMGGLFGPAAATAMEDLPYDARGILSGLFEEGYALGYLLAAIFYRALVPTTSHSWRSLFWFGSVPPIPIMIFRYYLPETHHFEAMKAEREARLKIQAEEGRTSAKASGLRAFLQDAGKGIKENWVLLIYLVVIMVGFNSCSHGSQDFYPTFLKEQVGLGPTPVTVIACLGPIAALLSGPVIGYVSTVLGRRLTMLICCVFGGAIIPAYIFPREPSSLMAASFFQQFFVGGVWGPIPIYLSELSPPALRGLLVGLTYQLGNLGSSASATIQAIIGERFPLEDGLGGKKRFDYGKVMGIFMGAVFVFIFVFIILGPEMSQEERDEEAEAARQLERMKMEGKTFAEIGEERARLEHKLMRGEMEEAGEKTEVQHIDEKA
ncbi:sialate:H+ symporter (SHS) family MFS transporter [Coccidioides immitis RS]|uniref:Sialate:H+ symporter (SHS) family MFS transporter n=1 Tax=Coccidioides immitis (strain RS) TaxID=246410 RepID=A0A0D8JUF5_COCIM|nr:sialate:H+ symporter (SHS) family MFS transporter [Coccidioides immitis RS]KJF60922.1 sialate:H+ symporter (SHS) family MFS transporter [Coccidioides immitis RS]